MVAEARLRPTQTVIRNALVGIIAGAIAIVVIMPPTMSAAIAAPYVTVAVVALGALLLMERRSSQLSRRVVLWTIGGLVLLAVVMPVHRSNDLWQYAFYGRLVSHYHLSPYNHTPREFPHDLVYSHLSPVWHSRASVYGPLFTGISAVGTALAGSSVLLIRLWFQGIAAIAVFACAVIVDRNTRDAAAVACIGLNPIVILYIVSGGHNDALVGLALLGAVLLAEARRPASSGAALAAAILVKIVTGLALFPLAWWTWRHHGRRPAVVLTGVAGALAGSAYAVGGGRVDFRPLSSASNDVSWTSIWRPIVGFLDGFHDYDILHEVGRIGLALVVSVTVVLVWAAVADKRPVRATTAALVAYFLLAPYVLVWYAFWSLPLLALRWRSAMTSLLLVFSAVMLLASEHRGLRRPDALEDFLHQCGNAMKVLAAVIIVLLIAGATRDRLRSRAALAPPPSPS